MIPTDRSKYSRFYIAYNIGRIQRPAQTGLQYDQIAVHSFKIQKSYCGFDLKYSRALFSLCLHTRNSSLNFFH